MPSPGRVPCWLRLLATRPYTSCACCLACHTTDAHLPVVWYAAWQTYALVTCVNCLWHASPRHVHTFFRNLHIFSPKPRHFFRTFFPHQTGLCALAGLPQVRQTASTVASTMPMKHESLPRLSFLQPQPQAQGVPEASSNSI